MSTWGAHFMGFVYLAAQGGYRDGGLGLVAVDGDEHDITTARAQGPHNEHPRCLLCGPRAFGGMGCLWRWRVRQVGDGSDSNGGEAGWGWRR
jgi:hypothetical protein